MISNKKLEELIHDDIFLELNELLKQPNVFSILKLERQEIRHSNFIAWLLNPNEKHGLGDLFLNLFLKDILSKEQFNNKGRFKWIKRESVADIDLFIEFDHLVIAIENKFDSDEHSDQLNKYKNHVQANYKNKINVLIYLTPEGRLTKNNSEYIIYSYHLIAQHINSILKEYKNLICARTTIYIEDYLHTIQSNIMKSNKENLLAAELFNKYSDAIKFIYENSNSDLQNIVNKINLLLSKKIDGYVKGSEEFRFSRFTTQNINSILRPIKTSKRRWANREPLLFEFSLEKGNGKLVFLVSVSDFDMKLNKEIDTIFQKGNLKKGTLPGTWKIYNPISIPFDYENYQDDAYIQEKFNELYTLALPTINLVEQLVIENKQQLIQAYS